MTTTTRGQPARPGGEAVACGWGDGAEWTASAGLDA